MKASEKLIEVHEHGGEGYLPLVDYDSWRVAILNYSTELRPENLKTMQRHNETDEVFVLLTGHCILFIGDGGEHITSLYAEDMQPFKLYNVKKGAWHTHTLSEDASVLVVENQDTNYDNSPFCELTSKQRQTLMDLTQKLA